MRKSKPVAISFTDEQLQALKDLAEKCDLSVSRVIHLMTIYMTYNTKGVKALKHLDAAFAGSAPNEIGCIINNEYHYYTWFIQLLYHLSNEIEPSVIMEKTIRDKYYEITKTEPSTWNRDIEHTMKIVKTKWIED